MDELTTQSMLNDPEMSEIVDSFIVETKEILEKLDFDLVNLESQPKDTDLLNEIFRGFHTIKGTSGFLGLEKLQLVTHKAEDILNRLRRGDAILDTELMDGILKAYDKINELMDVIESTKTENVEIDNTVSILNDLYEKVEKGLKNGKTIEIKEPDVVEESKVNEEKKSSPKKKAAKKKPANEETPVVDDKSESEKLEDISSEKEEKIEETKVEQNTPQVEEKVAPEKIEKPKPELKPAPVESKADEKKESIMERASNKHMDTTIRVDVNRLDDLLNIVSELVLGRNQLHQINSEFQMAYEGTKFSRDLFEASRQIDLMTNELQLVVMKTRMVKIGKVFNRYPRLVRDLARETKKEINLVIEGEETELDKTLIEEINDPLVHLIRNSVDHGVESPADREAAGKSSVGTIKLNAEHEGNNIIITIEDDGKGIDPEKIKSSAVKKGLITADKAEELSEQEVLNLIFLPGFSTAAKITNVSGRGVGMDVVKTNVSKLRGSINIESSVNKGTKIQISLPLTLAIIHGMIVRVKSESFVIPLNSVLEVLRISKEDIYHVNQKEVIRNRESTLPVLELNHLLRHNIVEDKSDSEDKKYQNVVVVKIAEKSFGIKVDELIGQKEVVIKSLGNYLGNVKGIAGSTIMGDGTVVMILDLSELMHRVS